jgi:hypothetical protein
VRFFQEAAGFPGSCAPPARPPLPHREIVRETTAASAAAAAADAVSEAGSVVAPASLQ